MSLAKLGNKLRREATASPKKAALLGLGALVAIYFWMPLVWGWIGKGDQNPAMATTASNMAPSVATTVPAAAPAGQAIPKETVPNRPAWSQIVQWMHKDPRTMIAPPLTKTRDPFEPPKSVEEEEEEDVDMTAEEEEASPKPPTITPTAAGLVLTSTIIGSQRRIAQINGKTYVVGQAVEVAKGKESPVAAFKLVEVHPRRVVLEANGERFPLIIPEPGKSDKIQFLGAVEK